MIVAQSQPWLKRPCAAGKPGRHARPLSKALFRPRLEALEDRTLLSTFVVDRLTDTGEGSDLAGDLRYCITQATSGQDTVTFGVTGTINLSSALPALNSNLIINGPGADNLTVRRNSGGNYRLFTVVNDTTILLSGLTITNGRVDQDDGAGIWNAGSLTVSHSTVSSNFTRGGKGAGIFNAGTLTLNDCTVSSNGIGMVIPAARLGGGIYNDGTLTVNDSTFSGNQAESAGGIYNAPSAMLAVSDSTLSGNVAFVGLEGGGGIFNDGKLTVSNSTFSRNDAYRDGGGISNSPSGVVTVSNSTLSGNQASLGGGGIFNRGALTVDTSTLSGNRADGPGGGIYNEGTLMVSNSTLSRNRAGNGGAIYNSRGTLTVSSSTLSDNGAVGNAGGIGNFEGTLKISNSTLSGNGAGIDGFGSAAISSTGSLEVSDSTISGNKAFPPFGNGVISIRGTATISNSTISDNTTYQGGTLVCSGTVTISNCTISGNTVGDIESVGGILNGGTLTVINSTISGNTGGPNGAGGIRNSGTLTVINSTISGNAGNPFLPAAGGIFNKGTLIARNTIIAGNTVSAGSGSDLSGVLTSLGHNLIGDTSGGVGFVASDLLNVNPLLGPLQDNGGPTQTMALLPGSPALDAGDNTDAPDFDQRGPGFARIVGGTIDIGAFEVQPGPATHFQVIAPAHVTSAAPFDVTVTALDAYGHTAVGYLGTVTFGSTDTDPGVLLPADYTFIADDQGVHPFVGGFVLITVADQTLTATDTSDNSITGSATVTVDPGPAAPPGGDASRPLTPTIAKDSTPSRSVQPCPEVASVDRFFASVMQQQYQFIFARLKHQGPGDDLFGKE